MARLSVCMVVANYPPHGGGSERQCALLARHLAQRGIDVTVLTRRLDEADSAAAPGVTVHRLGRTLAGRWSRAIGFGFAIVRHLRAQRYDIVHCHGFEPLALAGVVAQQVHALYERLVAT